MQRFYPEKRYKKMEKFRKCMNNRCRLVTQSPPQRLRGEIA